MSIINIKSFLEIGFKLDWISQKDLFNVEVGLKVYSTEYQEDWTWFFRIGVVHLFMQDGSLVAPENVEED